MSEAEQGALASLAERVAREAGALVLERREAGVTVAATKSSDIDIVTEADRASEELIRARILLERPDDSFLGEEGDDVVGTSSVRWVVDPIDGTVNFLYGLPDYAVSIAAEVDGEVVAGVVYDVAKDVMYAGHVGGQPTKDGRPVAVRARVEVSQRLVATGFNYVREVREVQARAVARLLPEVRDIRRGGACALDLCRVAEGALDGYVEEGVHLWDHAAGGLIARLAGAETRIVDGAGGNKAIVAGPADGFDELVAVVTSSGFLR